MQITETNAEGLKHEFTVTVAADDIERQVAARLAELGRTLRLPGFRPGKVPERLLRQRYLRSIMGEVLERTLSDSSAAAMRERNLRPALQPKVEIVNFNEGSSLEYKMAVEVLPEIQPMNFAELKLERLKPEVPDGEIDQALERIARQQRKSEPVTRPAETGDGLVIDFVGTVDGTPFPGGAAQDYTLELGSGSFIPGFEEQLVGAVIGDQRKVDVTFPADYGSADLAGKAAQFTVTVKEVRAIQPQPIDESLATAIGMENLEELRSAVRERIAQDYGRIARQRLKRVLLDRLAETHDFPVPEGMVEIEFGSIWKQVEEERQRLKDASATAADATSAPSPAPDAETPAAAPDAAAEDAPKTETETEPAAAAGDDKLKAEYRAIAVRRVRLGLLLSEVGRANNISVTQEELNRAVLEEARRFPGEERQVVEYYRNNPGLLDGLRAPIYEDKVVDFIVDKAEVADRLVPPAELMAAAAADDEEDASDAPDGADAPASA